MLKNLHYGSHKPITNLSRKHEKQVFAPFFKWKYQQDHYFFPNSSSCVSLPSRTRQFSKGWCATVRPNANLPRVDIKLCKQGAAARRIPSESSTNNLKGLSQMMNSSYWKRQNEWWLQMSCWRHVWFPACQRQPKCFIVFPSRKNSLQH